MGFISKNIKPGSKTNDCVWVRISDVTFIIGELKAIKVVPSLVYDAKSIYLDETKAFTNRLDGLRYLYAEYQANYRKTKINNRIKYDAVEHLNEYKINTHNYKSV